MNSQPCSFMDILDILACPKCKGPLELIENAGGSGLDCPKCDKIYPVKDDIPILLVDRAITRDDWNKGKNGE